MAEESGQPKVPVIRLLSDEVINQIAAGEVVERPSSVLKELVENSLDAGAKHIEVEVVDGGRRLVRIRDDGCGMDRESALLSLERHATSKLRALQDLDSIATMGFRGEALAAISAVSQFTLVTQREGQAAGTEIVVFGGKIQDVRDAGAPKGTELSVRNLFFNVPARRKFLRSASTEFTHIRQAFMLEALANEGVAFSLLADEELVFRLPAAASLLERVRDLYGKELASHLRPLQHGNGQVNIGGLAGLPPFSRMDREWQVALINGRPSGSPIINYAIQTAYRDVLPGGRYAPLFLKIDLPPDLVDVNVHPAKKEVRFRRPTEVRDLVIEAIRLAIAGVEDSRRHRGLDAPRGGGGDPLGAGGLHTSAPGAASTSAPVISPNTSPEAVPVSAPVFAIQGDLAFPRSPDSTRVGVPHSNDAPPPTLPATAPAVAGGASEDAAAPASPWAHYRVLGRMGGYAVLETDEGLVLMDPRSAHERVLFERMLANMDRGQAESQGLLPPVAVTLTPAQYAAIQRHLPLLRAMGFGVEEFGAETLMVESLPAGLAEVPPAALLSDIADGLMQGGRNAAKDWARPLIAERAGRQAVALERELGNQELDALIRALARTEMPYTSPRGKPTVILLSLRELNRKFGRE